MVDYSTLSAEELALTCFSSRDETAWAEFVRRFHPLIARIVLRVARQWGEEAYPQVADDLIQDTYLKLCSERNRLFQSFPRSHADAIYGFIKVFTANLVHDYFKAQRTDKRGGGSAGNKKDCENVPDLKSAESAIERDLLIRQIDACLKVVLIGPNAERDRDIFWLYYRVGLAASAIAALPAIGLTTKGVESTIARLTRQMRQKFRCSGMDRNGEKTT